MPNAVARLPLHSQFIFISESPDIAAIRGLSSVPDVSPLQHQELAVVDKLTDSVLSCSTAVRPCDREFKRCTERYYPSSGSILGEVEPDLIPAIECCEVGR